MTHPYFRHLHRRPVNCEHLFAVSPPVTLQDGQVADYVVAGFPMESIVGPDYGLQVFAADSDGRVIDWRCVWDPTAGDDQLPAGWPDDWIDVLLAAFE